MGQRVVGGLAERFFDLRFASACSTTAACTRGRLLFSSSGSRMVFTKTRFEKGRIDLLGMRMVLSHRSSWVDATCDLWGYVDGFLSDVLVPIALVSGGTHMAASCNWIFFPEASPSYFEPQEKPPIAQSALKLLPKRYKAGKRRLERYFGNQRKHGSH